MKLFSDQDVVRRRRRRPTWIRRGRVVGEVDHHRVAAAEDQFLIVTLSAGSTCRRSVWSAECSGRSSRRSPRRRAVVRALQLDPVDHVVGVLRLRVGRASCRVSRSRPGRSAVEEPRRGRHLSGRSQSGPAHIEVLEVDVVPAGSLGAARRPPRSRRRRWRCHRSGSSCVTVRWVAPLVAEFADAFQSPMVSSAPAAGWMTTFWLLPLWLRRRGRSAFRRVPGRLDDLSRAATW